MPNYLLLGAGFSRNWDGWLADEVFEYLIGHPEVTNSPSIRRRLWSTQRRGSGFEQALAELQQANASGEPGAKADLLALQAAVTAMFDEMNAAFDKKQGLEFDPMNTDPRFSVVKFLQRFDAIFTLNQDLLLERHYMPRAGKTWTESVTKVAGWDDVHLPGVTQVSHSTDSSRQYVQRSIPLREQNWEIRADDGRQPILKLHGSSNWYTGEDESLMVLGGNKVGAISSHQVLKRYSEYFAQCLRNDGARLMVIGYGFRDHHINLALIDAAKAGLKLFVVGPSGSDVENTNGKPQIVSPTDLGAAIEQALEGASRRNLSEIFRPRSLEIRKFERFLGVA